MFFQDSMLTFQWKPIKINVFATDSLLELASKNSGCRIVLALSVEVCGNGSEQSNSGFSENDFGYLDCNTVRVCYNESKRLSETLCRAYKSENSVNVVVVKLCRCYGPTLKKDDSKTLSQFISNAVAGSSIILKSSGKQYFSSIYSADAASALIFLMLNGVNGDAYNVSDIKSNIYLKDLSTFIANYCGSKVVFEILN